MPMLEHDSARLRDAQLEAITNLERSLKNYHWRVLMQMAAGFEKDVRGLPWPVTGALEAAKEYRSVRPIR